MIDFVSFEGRVRMTETVSGTSDFAQDMWIVPINDLGTDDADILNVVDSASRLNESFDGIRLENRIVVQDQDVVGFAGGFAIESRRDGGAEAGTLRQAEDPRIPQGLGKDVARPVARPAVDRDYSIARVGLGGQSRQAVAKPRFAVLDDEHDEDTRGLGVARGERTISLFGLGHQAS